MGVAYLEFSSSFPRGDKLIVLSSYFALIPTTLHARRRVPFLASDVFNPTHNEGRKGTAGAEVEPAFLSPNSSSIPKKIHGALCASAG